MREIALEDVPGRIAGCLASGDLEGALALFEPEATFVRDGGEVVTGVEAIRDQLHGMIELAATMTLAIRRVVQAGGTALVTVDWDMGDASGTRCNVMRRSPGGGWRVLIDSPAS